MTEVVHRKVYIIENWYIFYNMSVYVHTCVQGNPLAWAHMPTWMHILNKTGQFISLHGQFKFVLWVMALAVSESYTYTYDC